MKSIPFKTKPEYAFVYPKTDTGMRSGTHYPSRHLQKNFAGEETPGRGLSKDEVDVLPDGITVVYPSDKKKLIKQEIRRVFGKAITTTLPAKAVRNTLISGRKKRNS